jgi:2-methylisocitrate lyase-like PEP mutase family enzyme
MKAKIDHSTLTTRFRELHRGTVLVLPNAWDAGSAVVIEQAGATAIATTSAGVSWAAGAPDGQGLSRHQMSMAIGRIVQAVFVPVSADIESGYGRDLDDVVDTVRAIIEVGAVGINLEDSPGPDGSPLYSPQAQARRIAAARRAADDSGVDLFINARTDVYLLGAGPPERRLVDVQARGESYADAGADGLFVPGLADLDVIAVLAEGPLPLNVMAGPGMPAVAELAVAGVARVSVGSGITQAAYQRASQAASELLTHGTYEALADNIGYGDLNALLSHSP